MRRGYSGRLRHLHRSKRIHLGYLEETFAGDNPSAHLLKAQSKDQKGDILTKEMSGPRFEECKDMLHIVPIACTLPERSGRMLVCIGGKLKTVSEGIEHLTLIAKETDGGLKPGVDSWVADSGSGRHLVSRKVLDENASKHIVKVKEPIRLSTANGIVVVEEVVKIYIRLLDIWVQAWVLEETPLVISVDDIVKNHDWEFGMKNVRGKTFALLSKGSKRIKLSVNQGVPVFEA